MARPRQPIDLIAAKGKKHLTKAEIEERKNAEVKAPDDNIRAPSYLDGDLKEEFDRIAKELIRVKIMSNLDQDALARFIIARKMYVKVTQEMLTETDYLFNKDIVGIQDKYFKQCRAAASDLGLTISSRCKLVIPKNEEEDKPKSKWDAYK
ncbi:phage terminase small subunit P27 family [Clostridium tyrobutyricum]|uniref:Phage terminase small subunit n=1 Tax=Clostridium tyrobutyricum DIVETGP TaxID=1408889 RepID=W6N7K1_CLOTY|nr:phage terminase small subunit P27 family [Clostridium tyrobutyricum]AND83520.1 phage terminase, small subunit, P27 family [Clostridium tyrobutyricum]ANP68311.1 terminase [Clostridium tyrobutyricum]MBV4433174.1 phage terminase small subunit P27 family [Clostridium tyrobutyricum]QNB67343.1 phage terminase small subunit P27 family [Clostridium tyrobutyricum]CDL91334.1 Phage terminase small subunit [Clostridium tyrobutyricum DIVETGP]